MVSITRIGSLVFAFTLVLQGLLVPEALAQRPRLTESPRFVLERTLRAWDDISDYEAMIDYLEIRPSSEQKRFWMHLRAVREPQANSEVGGTLRLDVYDHDLLGDPVSAEEVHSVTPVEFYFITPLGRFVTYRQGDPFLVVQDIDPRDPLPQFLQIAGFLNVSLEQIEERIELGDKVVETEVNGRTTQRITLKPRAEYAAIEPVRQLWVDPQTHLPVQFIVDGELYIRLRIEKPRLNQNLDSETLTPRVTIDYPEGTRRIRG